MIIMWDTSALISLFDDGRPSHDVAKKCYVRFVEADECQFVSTIALAEFALRNDPRFILKNRYFQVQDFNVNHALKSAAFKRLTLDPKIRDDINKREVIVNDTQIIGQAHVEQVDYILTEDKRTFKRTVDALRDSNAVTMQALLLCEDPLAAVGYSAGE